MNDSHTYATRLTPAGTGALAVIGVLGPDAHAIVQSLLAEPRDLTRCLPGSFRLVRVGPEPCEQVVITAETVNGQPLVELHCHGGPAVVDWLMNLLKEKGARVIDGKAWLQLTSLSRLRAAAELALTQAPTCRVAGILLDQMHGAGDGAVAKIVDLLDQGQEAAALEAVESMLAWRPLAEHLLQPWRVALAGPPNVGKSTLLNALVGFQRAITAPSPGTTRDVVSALTAFDGWPVELLDTAGIRAEAEGLEAQGIERTLALCTEVDLILWLLDASQPPEHPPAEFAQNTLLVLNKVDLPMTWTPQEGKPMCPVSARGGNGVQELIGEIAARLVPRVPPAGAGLLVTDGSWDALAKARQALLAGNARLARRCLDELMRPVDASY